MKLNRRNFVKGTAGAAGVGYFVNPAKAVQKDSPNERLNIAAVGAAGRNAGNINGVATQNLIAIADADANLLDKGSANFPTATKYRDYRIMLEKEEGRIDAVVVGTPDHSHAPAAAMALRMKKTCLL